MISPFYRFRIVPRVLPEYYITARLQFRPKLTPFIPRSKDRGMNGWVSYKLFLLWRCNQAKAIKHIMTETSEPAAVTNPMGNSVCGHIAEAR